MKCTQCTLFKHMQFSVMGNVLWEDRCHYKYRHGGSSDLVQEVTKHSVLQNILLNAKGKNIPIKKSNSDLKTTLKKELAKVGMLMYIQCYTCKLDIMKVFFFNEATCEQECLIVHGRVAKIKE